MSLRTFADPTEWTITQSDLELFQSRLRDFVPPGAFDAHAHWYDLRHLLDDGAPIDQPEVGHDAMLSSTRRWMGDRATTEGLYFGFPIRTVDCAAENRFVADQVRDHSGCRGLMLIRPDDDPAESEQTLITDGFSGFKVYHVFAEREDSFHCEQGEFLPDWAWEIADRRGLDSV